MRSKLRIVVLFLMMISLLSSCKKAAGPGGKAFINGQVTYKNGASGSNDFAKQAIVYITYGTKEVSNSYDQAILTDDIGTFRIKGLRKGDYYIRAEYTDANGFKYGTQGFGVSLKEKKAAVELLILLE